MIDYFCDSVGALPVLAYSSCPLSAFRAAARYPCFQCCLVECLFWSFALMCVRELPAGESLEADDRLH